MTDRYTFYISFHDTTKGLDDAQYGQLMKAVNEYAFYGAEPPPDMPPVIKMAFGLIAPVVDTGIKNRNEYLASVERGKKGGAPKGNRNAESKQPRQPKQPPVVWENNPPLNKKTTPETTPETTMSRSRSRSRSRNLNKSGDGDTENNQPPPPLVKKIISEAGRLGFAVDTEKAVEFYNSGIDPSWLESPGSFLELAAERATSGAYREKPRQEQRNLFLDAAIRWENLREEYPDWLADKRREAAAAAERGAREEAEAARRKKIEEAEQAAPSMCEKCGGPLDETLACPVCKVFYVLDESSLRFRAAPMNAFAAERALKKQKERRWPGS
jgi:hypothetical protein